MRQGILGAVAAVTLGLAVVGCSTNPAPKTEAGRETMQDKTTAALSSMKQQDSTLDNLLKRSYGYAIFPSVAKGGLIVGGAYGKGEVYRKGELIGYADLTQATAGLQAGGQTYSELIVFENAAALNKFTEGKFAFSGNVSAVAMKAGSAGTAQFADGLVIFTKPEGGLMFEASIGGQEFNYRSKASAENPTK